MITAVQWTDATATLAGAGATLRHVVIPAGMVAARHEHAHEQFLFVASGGGVLRGEAGDVVLTLGVALHLPAGAWHSAVFRELTVLIEVNIVV